MAVEEAEAAEAAEAASATTSTRSMGMEVEREQQDLGIDAGRV